MGISAASPAVPLSPERLDEAVRDLGDDRQDIRELASRRLFESGMSALPALKKAAIDTNPEIRLRAEQILGHFSRGVFADTPADVAELADRYPAATESERHNLVGELARRGGYGYVVLIKLADQEEDLWLKGWIAQLLGNEPGAALMQTAAVMIQRGDSDGAERLLATGAETGNEPAIRAYVALLRDHDRLAGKIIELQAGFDRGDVGYVPITLIYLLRAAGQMDRAAIVAEKENNRSLSQAIALERRDWKKLADLFESEPEKQKPDFARLGLLAAAQRLGGNAAGFEKTIARTLELYRANRGNYWPAATVLLVNERMDQATKMLLEQQRYLTVFELDHFANRFDDALAVAAQAQVDGHADAIQLQARAALLRWRLGESDAAKALLAALVPRSLPDLLAVIDAEREVGRTDPAVAVRASEHWTKALRMASLTGQGAGIPHPQLTTWLADNYPNLGAAAGDWWGILAPPENATAAEWNEAANTFRQVLENRVPADHWESLINRLHDPAIPASNGAPQMRRLELLIDALDAAGQKQLADTSFDRLREIFSWAHGVSRPMCVFVPKRLARLKLWTAAAEAAEICAGRYGDSADLFWLRGWAIHESGMLREGNTLMAQARTHSFGDEQNLQQLADTMNEFGHPEESSKTRQEIFRVGTPRGIAFYSACYRLAVDIAPTDPAAAADLWQTYNLVTLDVGGSFHRDIAYLEVPRYAHLQRARAFCRLNKTAEAMVEFRALADGAPLNIEVALAVVPELKKLDMEPTARAVFDLVYKPLAEFVGQHPNSAYFHNEIAWLAVRCGYELDAARLHAERAVALQPRETNSIDTLAEVHFRRGDRAKAIELMKQCEVMEPDQPRHHQRRQEFEK